MARGFGSSRGVGSTDAIAATVNLSPSARVAVFAIALRNGNGGGGFGRICDIGSSNCAFYFDSGTSELIFQYRWSGGTAIWRAAAPSSGVFHSVGFDYDPSSTANDPLIYVNGASVTVTEQTAPSGTATTDAATALRWGNRSGGDRNWDGDLARVAWWRGGSPTGAEFASMHGGTVPSSIQAGTLIYYNSLSGGTTPSVGTNVSVTGTADQADPTFDTTAPTLISPTGTGGVLVCSGSVSTNEANGTLYAVATASATSPSAAQVKAGQDHTGAAALRVVSQAVSGTGVQNIASGAVTAGTRYLHFMHEDAATNQSTVASSASFVVTAAADTTPPTLSGSITIGTVTANSIQMSWPAGADNVAVTSYEVSSNGGSSYADVGSVLTYTFTGLTPSTSYGLRVRAKDAASNVSTPALSATQSTSAAGATLTSSALKDNTGTLHLSAPFEAFVLDATTGALVLHKTGLTSHASTGVVTFADAALTASTAYRVVWRQTTTGAQGIETLVAA